MLMTFATCVFHFSVSRDSECRINPPAVFVFGVLICTRTRLPKGCTPASAAGKASAIAFSEVVATLCLLIQKVQEYGDRGLIAREHADTMPVLEGIARLWPPQGIKGELALLLLETAKQP
jgi:hypothetical protein